MIRSQVIIWKLSEADTQLSEGIIQYLVTSCGGYKNEYDTCIRTFRVNIANKLLYVPRNDGRSFHLLSGSKGNYVALVADDISLSPSMVDELFDDSVVDYNDEVDEDNDEIVS